MARPHHRCEDAPRDHREGQDAHDALDAAKKAGDAAKVKIDAERAALTQQREQACFAKFPDKASPNYQDCVLIITGTDSDRARIMLERGSTCEAYNTPGSPSFNRCVMPDNIFAVDFVPQQWMQFLPTLEQAKIAQEKSDKLLIVLTVTIEARNRSI